MTDVDRTESWRVAPDVQFGIYAGGVLASNYRARRHVWLALPLFHELAGGRADGDLAAADLSRFSNLDGLLADPTRLDRSTSFDKVTFPDIAAALEFLKRRFIVIGEGGAYEAYFTPRRSLIDQNHFGTFHQQLGAELRLRLRTDPDLWWRNQKFSGDAGAIRPTLYRSVQEAFLDRYLPSLGLDGLTVLDFGCGTGMAARRFVGLGARVIGIDTNPEHLAQAAEAIGPSFSPIRLDLSADRPFDELPSDPVDVIWLSDVLMFYFHPLDGGRSPITASDALAALAARLKLGGRCVIMQPHGVFWLTPWLGDPERPFTVLTEYARRLYSVTPGLEELSKAIAAAGLVIACVHEPKPDPAFPSEDPRADSFAAEFPQWWVFECVKPRNLT